jgi:hypothetical protein
LKLLSTMFQTSDWSHFDCSKVKIMILHLPTRSKMEFIYWNPTILNTYHESGEERLLDMEKIDHKKWKIRSEKQNSGSWPWTKLHYDLGRSTKQESCFFKAEKKIANDFKVDINDCDIASAVSLQAYEGA